MSNYPVYHGNLKINKRLLAKKTLRPHAGLNTMMDEWHEQRRMCCSHPWPARSKYLNKKKKILSSPESPGVNSRGTVSDPGDNKSSPQG